MALLPASDEAGNAAADLKIVNGYLEAMRLSVKRTLPRACRVMYRFSPATPAHVRQRRRPDGDGYLWGLSFNLFLITPHDLQEVGLD